MFNNSKRKYNAFTLVEALVALSILLTGIISGFILVTRALYNAKVIQDRLTASFLAQEGIELVRKIRDTNYVKNINGVSTNWNNGLANGSYYISVDPDSKQVRLSDNYKDQEAQIPNLKYDKNNFQYGFNYKYGDETNFKRIIRIKTIDSNHLRVQSVVAWNTRNISFLEGQGAIVAEDHLYNWLSY